MKGPGAGLFQKGRPVIYAFRTLMPTETGYSNIERELLGVVFVLERPHQYVSGSKIKEQTNHRLLIPVQKKSIAAVSPQL